MNEARIHTALRVLLPGLGGYTTRGLEWGEGGLN